MTTFAPTFTPRLRVGYTVGRVPHSITVRGARGATLATMGGLVDPVANCFVALAAYMFAEFAWLDAAVALTDSEIFNPVAVSGIIPVGAIPVGATSAVARIRQLTITGRAPDSRARLSLFGMQFASGAATDVAADGVVTGAEVPGILTVAGIANTYFHAGSGAGALWRTRGTYKTNDHLLRLVRRGTIV